MTKFWNIEFHIFSFSLALFFPGSTIFFTFTFDFICNFPLSKKKLSIWQIANLCTVQFCSYRDKNVQYKGWRIVTLTVCSLTKWKHRLISFCKVTVFLVLLNSFAYWRKFIIHLDSLSFSCYFYPVILFAPLDSLCLN